MSMSILKHICSTFIVTFILVGCSAPEPYVWRPYTIDRSHVDFPDGPTLITGSQISICYNKRGATPIALQKMANQECGRFGMTSRFAKQEHGVCPLATPIAAQFTCVGGSAEAIKKAANQQRPGSLFQDTGQNGVSGSVLPSFISTFNAEDVSTTAKSQPYPTFLFNNEQKRP